MYEEIFANLNPQQRDAVETLDGPLLVMAGAGSGKTRVLTCRVANLLAHGVKPWNILAITFTNKAANEMKTRVQKLVGDEAKNIWLSTFHSFCARILRYEVDITGKYKNNFVIYDSSDSRSMISKCLDELYKDEANTIDISSVQSMISNAKNNFISAEKFIDWRISMHEERGDPAFLRNSERIVSEVYPVYMKKLVANNAMDFDDLLLVTVALFHEFPNVLEKYQKQFKYISIDEYQDTNGVQYRLANMLAAEHHNICVVGDADQSIYGFRGADFRNILKFEEDYPEAKVIKLEQNYRSTKKILDAANAVIENNELRKEKNLWTQNPDGTAIKLLQSPDPFREASTIVRTIYQLHLEYGEPFKHFAILYRANWLSRVFEEKLMQAKIPYVIVGGLKFFDRKEIKDILAYLRILQNPRDEISLVRALQVPRRGIGKGTIDKISELAGDAGMSFFEFIANPKMLDRIPNLRSMARLALENFASSIMDWQIDSREIPVDTLAKNILNDSGILREINDISDEVNRDSRLENVDEFLRLIQEFVENPEIENHSLDEFLMNISLMTDLDEDVDSRDCVSLMTVHAAKGLEFPTVFLVGMEEGIFPHSRSINSQEGLEEERRACYVALTRAQKNLCVSYSMQRTSAGRLMIQEPSRFLNEIPRDCFENFEKKADSERKSSSYERKSLSNPKKTLSSPQKSIPVSIKPKTKVDTKLILNVGDEVEHSMFGRGTIESVTGSGENSIIKIRFSNGETKTFSKKFAPLKKI